MDVPLKLLNPTRRAGNRRQGATAAPEDAFAHEAELWISSDDPDSPVGIVRLLGNIGEDPEGDDPPEVEVASPNDGAFIMDDESAVLIGSVYDPNEAATQLLCAIGTSMVMSS